LNSTFVGANAIARQYLINAGRVRSAHDAVIADLFILIGDKQKLPLVEASAFAEMPSPDLLQTRRSAALIGEGQPACAGATA
jgi:hypothetical protein